VQIFYVFTRYYRSAASFSASIQFAAVGGSTASDAGAQADWFAFWFCADRLLQSVLACLFFVIISGIINFRVSPFSALSA
jgi:hypothetical protein